MPYKRLRAVAAICLALLVILTCESPSEPRSARDKALDGNGVQLLHRVEAPPDSPPQLRINGRRILPIAYYWHSPATGRVTKRAPDSISDDRVTALRSPKGKPWNLVLESNVAPERVEIRWTASPDLTSLANARVIQLCRHPCGTSTTDGWALPRLLLPANVRSVLTVAMYSIADISSPLFANTASYVLQLTG